MGAFLARRVLGPALLLLVFAACSSGEADTTTSSSTTTTAAITTPAPTTTATTTSTTTTTTTSTTTTTTLAPPVTLARSSIFVTTIGMGPIDIGMTVEEAEAAAGFTLDGEPDPQVSEDCYYVTPPADQAAYEGVAFMVVDDAIARVDVGGMSEVTTRSGAGIGISQAALEAMFPGQIEAAPDAVVDGTAVQFVPRDEKDNQYRVIFVLTDGLVSQLRAGILPAVGYGEGCL